MHVYCFAIHAPPQVRGNRQIKIIMKIPGQNFTFYGLITLALLTGWLEGYLTNHPAKRTRGGFRKWEMQISPRECLIWLR